MNSVFFLILRRMRAPLIVLVVFYAVGVLVLALVPGQHNDGAPAPPPPSFFHAFYFISYTATTIGFIDERVGPAVRKALLNHQSINVDQLLRDNADREAALPAVVLMVVRQGQSFLLPGDDFSLQADDALLIVGQHAARSALFLTLQNTNALEYVIMGQDRRGGRLWQFLFRNQ